MVDLSIRAGFFGGWELEPPGQAQGFHPFSSGDFWNHWQVIRAKLPSPLVNAKLCNVHRSPVKRPLRAAAPPGWGGLGEPELTRGLTFKVNNNTSSRVLWNSGAFSSNKMAQSSVLGFNWSLFSSAFPELSYQMQSVCWILFKCLYCCEQTYFWPPTPLAFAMSEHLEQKPCKWEAHPEFSPDMINVKSKWELKLNVWKVGC